jgi:uncharacterized protein (DUF1330 family)
MRARQRRDQYRICTGRYSCRTGCDYGFAARVRGSAVSRQTLHPSQEDDMKAYVIADIRVTDESWIPAYATTVHELVHKHGGRYLARSGNVRTLEGRPLATSLIALMEFPSTEAAEAFVGDPQYAPFSDARRVGSDSRFQLIDGTDLAGTIPYLPKG